MVLPSGEKATELMQSLCAFSFSALSSREAAASVGALRFGLGEGSGGVGGTCIPDFERLVAGACKKAAVAFDEWKDTRQRAYKITAHS